MVLLLGTFGNDWDIFGYHQMGFPHSSVSKDSACNAGDLGSVSGWGRTPGEGNGNPLQYSCLENPMDRGAQQVTYSPWSEKLDIDLVTKPPPPARALRLPGLNPTCQVLNPPKYS